MRRLCYFALRACSGVFVAVIGAQLLLMDAAAQTKTNVNVLPAYINPADPDAYLKGDQYMQRQVEPTYMVSTRNPDHHIVFFNDYRAVDVVVADTGLGEARGIVKVAMEWLQRLFRDDPANRRQDLFHGRFGLRVLQRHYLASPNSNESRDSKGKVRSDSRPPKRKQRRAESLLVFVSMLAAMR